MEPLKTMINVDVIDELAERIWVKAPFDHARFKIDAANGLDELDLKHRIEHIAAAFNDCFECDYSEAIAQICDGFDDLPAEYDDEQMGKMRYWPILSFVEKYGVEHPEVSLDALYHLTYFFSGEFAIRPFIERYPDLTFKRMEEWVVDESPHVRRLVSEGSRPRLPWGGRLKAIQKNPDLTLPFLEALKDDPVEFVRRSVANHLNDFSKDHPEYVVEIAQRWWSDDPQRQKLVKHALRTLLKKGDPDALAVLGFGKPSYSNEVVGISTPHVALGDALEFSASLEAKSKQKWMIDYAIHHVKANGQTSPKVFKWVTRDVKKGDAISIEKRHVIKPISTRKYYEGTHAVEVFVNGCSIGKASFELSLG